MALTKHGRLTVGDLRALKGKRQLSHKGGGSAHSSPNGATLESQQKRQRGLARLFHL